MYKLFRLTDVLVSFCATVVEERRTSVDPVREEASENSTILAVTAAGDFGWRTVGQGR
jgi:hypothetical protein